MPPSPPRPHGGAGASGASLADVTARAASAENAGSLAPPAQMGAGWGKGQAGEDGQGWGAALCQEQQLRGHEWPGNEWAGADGPKGQLIRGGQASSSPLEPAAKRTRVDLAKWEDDDF
jgi:hypothetical protein